MADAFEYRFVEPLFVESQLNDIDPRPDALLGDIVAEAKGTVAAIEQFRGLPEANQTLILEMAERMIHGANEKALSLDRVGRENFWGLYVIGSQATGEAGSGSDLDLMSVGTLGRKLHFLRMFGRQEDWDWTIGTPFKGFGSVKLPDDHELPDEYNVGEVERKYWVMASSPERSDTLDVDLAVVDLTDIRGDLEHFKTAIDIENGQPLPRVPLVELTIAEHELAWTL